MVAQRLNRSDLLRGMNELCACDADLANIVGKYGPPPMWGRRPGFATLSRIILEQQVSLASANAPFARLRHGVGRVTAGRLAGLTPAKLRRLGLTRQKAGYCLDLARLVTDGDLDLQRLGLADDTTARQRTSRSCRPFGTSSNLCRSTSSPGIRRSTSPPSGAASPRPADDRRRVSRCHTPPNKRMQLTALVCQGKVLEL